LGACVLVSSRQRDSGQAHGTGRLVFLAKLQQCGPSSLMGGEKRQNIVVRFPNAQSASTERGTVDQLAVFISDDNDAEIFKQ